MSWYDFPAHPHLLHYQAVPLLHTLAFEMSVRSREYDVYNHSLLTFMYMSNHPRRSDEKDSRSRSEGVALEEAGCFNCLVDQ